jgi:hypothetical protein
MADAKKLSPDEINELVNKFQSIENPDEKAKFYWDNAPLHSIFRAVHFPKPEPEPAATRP